LRNFIIKAWDFFLKAWKDPVGSKFIYLGITGLCWLVYDNWHVICAFLKKNISVWITILVLVGVWLAFKLLFKYLKNLLGQNNPFKIKIDIASAFETIKNDKYIKGDVKLKLLGYQQPDPSLPYKRNLCDKDYEPGTHTLAKINEDAKFMEQATSFDDWLDEKLDDEFKVLKKRAPKLFKDFKEKNDFDDLKKTIKTVLESKTNYEKTLKDDIWYQEYSDILRRIIFFILKSNPDHEIELYPNLTHERKNLIFGVIRYIEKHKKPKVAQWLKLSIAAGALGVDEKQNDFFSGGKLNADHVIPLDRAREARKDAIERIGDTLWEFASTTAGIDASQWFSNFCKFSGEMKLRLVSFSNDYLETIFLLRYYQELLDEYKHIEIDLVPRSVRCGDDATYKDVKGFLKSFPKLKFSPNFRVHKDGPKIGTVNLFKLHPSIMNLIEQADLIDARGARHYEVLQGIKKDICFGFIICRGFSESAVGFARGETPLVYIKQKSGEKSFSGFRKRHERQQNGLMLCQTTANDNKAKHQGGHLASYEQWSDKRRNAFDKNRLFYSSTAIAFHKKYGYTLEPNVKKFLKEFKGEVLVVGCGSGKEVDYLQKHQCEAYGIDFCFEAIKIAKILYPELWDRFSVEDLYNIGFYDEDTFDGVVFNAALIHLLEKKDLSSILTDTKRILKPDGLCFIRVLRKDGVDQDEDYGPFELPRDFVYYTKQEIYEHCRRLDFKIVGEHCIERNYEKQHVGNPECWVSVLVKNIKPAKAQKPSGEEVEVENVAKAEQKAGQVEPPNLCRKC